MRTLSPARAKTVAKRLRPFVPAASHAQLVRALTTGQYDPVADDRLPAAALATIVDDLVSPDVATLDAVGALVFAGAPTTAYPTVNTVARGDMPDHIALTCHVTGTAVRAHPALWAAGDYVTVEGLRVDRYPLGDVRGATDPLTVADALVRVASGQWCATCGLPVVGRPERCAGCTTEWPGADRHTALQVVESLRARGCDSRLIGETLNVAWDHPQHDGWLELNVVWADTDRPFVTVQVEEPAGEVAGFGPYEEELADPGWLPDPDELAGALIDLLRDVNEQARAEVDA